MKKGVIVGVFVLVILLISISFVSAFSFNDFLKKLFGIEEEEILLSPGAGSTSAEFLNVCQCNCLNSANRDSDEESKEDQCFNGCFDEGIDEPFGGIEKEFDGIVSDCFPYAGDGPHTIPGLVEGLGGFREPGEIDNFETCYNELRVVRRVSPDEDLSVVLDMPGIVVSGACETGGPYTEWDEDEDGNIVKTYPENVKKNAIGGRQGAQCWDSTEDKIEDKPSNGFLQGGICSSCLSGDGKSCDTGSGDPGYCAYHIENSEYRWAKCVDSGASGSVLVRVGEGPYIYYDSTDGMVGDESVLDLASGSGPEGDEGELNCIDFDEPLGGTGSPDQPLTDLVNSRVVYISFLGSASVEACKNDNGKLDGACDDESGGHKGLACDKQTNVIYSSYQINSEGTPPPGTVCRTDEDSGDDIGCVGDVLGAEECRFGVVKDCTNQCKKAVGKCSKFYSSVTLKDVD